MFCNYAAVDSFCQLRAVPTYNLFSIGMVAVVSIFCCILVYLIRNQRLVRCYFCDILYINLRMNNNTLLGNLVYERSLSKVL